MKRSASALLVLLLATAVRASAGEATQPAGDSKQEIRTAGQSNSAATSLPQLAPNPGTVPEVPLAREPELPAPSPKAATEGAQRRKTIWMILAIAGVLVFRRVLRKGFARSEPS